MIAHKQRAGRPSGADGIRDQQLTLQWVQDNIASFHGDPSNVTVFGESAGASAVCVHLVSPGSRGLARRYILESGVCTDGVSNGIEAIARDRAYATSGQMVSALCASAADPIACLRGLPADQIINWALSSETMMSLSWGPVIEGQGGVLPEHPDALIARGAFNRGEVLIGTNKNEAGLFNPIPLVSASDLRNTVRHADEMGYVFGDGNYALAFTNIVPALQNTMQRAGGGGRTPQGPASAWLNVRRPIARVTSFACAPVIAASPNVSAQPRARSQVASS